MTFSVAQNGLTAQDSGILAELTQDGFSVRRGLAPHTSTIDVAQTLGTLINVQGLLPGSGIPTVQSLRPRNTNEAGENQYSGHYGLGTFPLHTDLAHWALPPHYFLLRCVVGSDDVFTHILPWTPIVGLIGTATLQKAVFAARRRRIGYSGLVRAMSRHEGSAIFRWDPVFLLPLNQHAQALTSVMLGLEWSKKAAKILLNQPGDTLMIDNWRMLHGRGEVKPQSAARNIDRAYVSEVFQ